MIKPSDMSFKKALTMNVRHAAIWLDRNRARVLHFEDQQFRAHRFMKTIERLVSDAGSAGIDGGFFHDVCDAVGEIPQLLLTGTSEAIADFERYAESKAPLVARRIMGVQRVDTPTNNGLSVLACWHFKRPAGPRVAVK
jgi:hypothetical protein